MRLLKLMSTSNKIGASSLWIKEDPYWKVGLVDHCISPMLHNRINFGNIVLFNLLCYGNDKIKKILLKNIFFVNIYM